ncbi:hypothetical protein B1A99_29465 [Cohnella sp. CIP 111063]|nr:hypothetical protein B1A99_29465 [Cohnella sp. CIP 111063]
MSMRLIRLSGRFRRFSFKSKLFLSYILIVLIPVSISAAWIYNEVIVPMRGERLQLIDQTMSQLQATVNKEVDDLEKTGYLISTNIVLKKALLKRYYDQSELIDVMNTSIQSLLSWFASTHQDIGEFRFFTVNETLPESDFFLPISRYSGEDWFRTLQERIAKTYPYWESWHIQRDYPYGKKSNQPVYSLFYPINEDFAGETSYLELEINIDRFFSKSISMALSPSGGVFAVDWNGQLLSVPREFDESTKQRASRDAFRQIDLSVAGQGNIELNGVSYRYVIQPIDRLHTSLVGLLPHSEINRPWEKTRDAFLLLILLLAILLAILSFALAGLLIKKIVRIVGNVRKIQNGNFKVRIPVKGEDEIDLLALNINSMAGQIDDLINRVYKSQVSQKEAELKALQAQINPHFLFNTLETLRMMAETEDQARLSDAIAALGNIMRYNIYNGQEPITLETELEHIQDYLHIQNLLLNQRVSLECEIPESLMAFRIPNLLLQPLVENCIVHGMRGFSGRLTIRISAEGLPENLIRYEVRDNGKGISSERLDALRDRLSREPDQRPIVAREAPGASSRAGSIGLANVRDRIHYCYGSSATMEIDASPDKGTIVALILPANSIL